MTDRTPQPATEDSPAAIRRHGLIESVVQKLLARQARVDFVESLNQKFRLITLQGESLKDVDWTPGNKVQIMLGGWVQRTYTPIDWDRADGRTRFLAYLHAEGPGTHWARSVQVGDSCTIFGPRRSINLEAVRRPAVFCGDETTFGLASAMRACVPDEAGIEYLFELSTPSESLDVLELLGLSNASHCNRRDNDAHMPELEARMLELLNSHNPTQFVLSGRSVAIQRLQKLLRQKGYATSQFHTLAYWAPGKKGLD
jgi:ferric-chelate reductase (NADPH)